MVFRLLFYGLWIALVLGQETQFSTIEFYIFMYAEHLEEENFELLI